MKHKYRKMISLKSIFGTSRTDKVNPAPRGNCLNKGLSYRRVIYTKIVDGKEICLHATKGWRCRRF